MFNKWEDKVILRINNKKKLNIEINYINIKNMHEEIIK
jgi:hypothetical protein